MNRSYKPLDEDRQLNLGLLQEEQLFLTSEPLFETDPVLESISKKCVKVSHIFNNLFTIAANNKSKRLTFGTQSEYLH